MNAIDRIGMTLLHFVWQGVLIAAAYAAVRRVFLNSSGPAARYLLACAALAAMMAAPLITWMQLQPPAPAAIAATFAAPPAVHTAGVGSAQAIVETIVERGGVSFLPWVVGTWAAGALVCWLRLSAGWIVVRRLRSRLVHPAPQEWQLALERLKTRVRFSAPVRLLVSSIVQAPAAVGWLRPVILVPAGAFAGLSAAQIEALLLHELAHIRRADYFVNLLQGAVEALLFYHPAVWWVSNHIRAERELCCDDVAVSLGGDATAYARALAELELARPVHLAAAANGGSLAHRIARLLGRPMPAANFSSPALSGAAILAVAGLAVFAQSTVKPQFEVATVKLVPASGPQRIRPMPGRLIAEASVRLLMQNAYALQPFQIAGGPDWIASERYSIEAKADGNASREQIFLMLQSLLEDRFRLNYHREERELPVWHLTVAKSGSKLPAPREGNCIAPSSAAPAEWGGGRMAPPGQVPGAPPPCGSVRIGLEAAGARMQGGNVLMAELARMLSLALGRTVVDKTGYTKSFDLQLDFLPDAVTTAMPAPPPGSDISERSNAPSILVALREQLGLRLESAKGPVEVLVIDHIERPRE
ncbi:MAG TPA: M56 family metallopeptidase [Candidatus Solibacter sp.]|nr:M56 family metallopeptidase [Candidatus Solibacter sp.]